MELEGDFPHVKRKDAKLIPETKAQGASERARLDERKSVGLHTTYYYSRATTYSAVFMYCTTVHSTVATVVHTGKSWYDKGGGEREEDCQKLWLMALVEVVGCVCGLLALPSGTEVARTTRVNWSHRNGSRTAVDVTVKFEVNIFKVHY